MRSPGILCVLALFPLAFAASAQEFLAPAERDFSQVLPPPPADTSPAGLADLDTVLQLQQERTPAQVARARRVAAQSQFSFGQAVLGGWFTPENLPRTTAIFDEINRENKDAAVAAKQAAHRPRPYERDTRIVLVVPRPHDGPSYPSGHSERAALWAAVLTAAFPGDGAAFQAQVRETMWCRELGGAHYPTDTEAGLLLGGEVARRMLASPAMTRALEEIRAEAAPFQLKAAATPAPSAASTPAAMPAPAPSVSATPAPTVTPAPIEPSAPVP